MGADSGSHTLEELIDELARVLHHPDSARDLALRAGFPPADLPAFETPRVFWGHVLRALADGKTVAGVEAIVEQAKAAFPGNRLFAGYCSLTPGELPSGAASVRPSRSPNATGHTLEAELPSSDTNGDIIHSRPDNHRREHADAKLDALPLDDLRRLVSRVAERGKPTSLPDLAELESTLAAIARRMVKDLRLLPSDVPVVQSLIVLQLDVIDEAEPTLFHRHPYTRRDGHEWFATAWTLSLQVPTPDGVDPSKHAWELPGWVDALSLGDVPHGFPWSSIQPLKASTGVRRLIELAPRVIAKLERGPLGDKVPRLLLPAMFLDEAFHDRLEPRHLRELGGTWEERSLVTSLSRLPLASARRVANRIWELARGDATEAQHDSVAARIARMGRCLDTLADPALKAVDPAAVEDTARTHGLLVPHYHDPSELDFLSREQLQAALRGWHQRARDDPQAWHVAQQLHETFDLDDLELVVDLVQASPAALASELAGIVWRISPPRAAAEAFRALEQDLPASAGWFFATPYKHLGALVEALEQTGRRPDWLGRWADRFIPYAGEMADRIYAIARGRSGGS